LFETKLYSSTSFVKLIIKGSYEHGFESETESNCQKHSHCKLFEYNENCKLYMLNEEKSF